MWTPANGWTAGGRLSFGGDDDTRQPQFTASGRCPCSVPPCPRRCRRVVRGGQAIRRVVVGGGSDVTVGRTRRVSDATSVNTNDPVFPPGFSVSN